MRIEFTILFAICFRSLLLLIISCCIRCDIIGICRPSHFFWVYFKFVHCTLWMHFVRFIILLLLLLQYFVWANAHCRAVRCRGETFSVPAPASIALSHRFIMLLPELFFFSSFFVWSDCRTMNVNQTECMLFIRDLHTFVCTLSGGHRELNPYFECP